MTPRLQEAEKSKTAAVILELAERANLPLADHVARFALLEARKVLNNPSIAADTLIVSRDGRIIGRARALANGEF